ncbi:hypothetical protein [Streptosporangium sp. NBC_01469]|uniref:hypothetical protein n=1 Tax=Streptosporangium sp. NBC_01469 TaxID=2903898 RepID=UPI002E2AF8CA|nr:hypothetical protein [Streptosporangium sp. NBC_01469]
MPDDSDHVLDSIDGAVDEWLAMSDDSMRWTPPEKARPKPQLGLPVPPLPQVLEDLLQEVGTRLGPPAQAVVDAFRPLGEGVVDAVSTFLDSPPMRQLLDPPDPSGERPEALGIRAFPDTFGPPPEDAPRPPRMIESRPDGAGPLPGTSDPSDPSGASPVRERPEAGPSGHDGSPAGPQPA